MRFGHFDDRRKEYVITRPDTPRSWSNYLGSTEYGAIITNNAGGYSFFHSAAQGRFTRWRPNNLPMDQPGRYFYLRDRDSGDFWSSSWQPVGKSLASKIPGREFKSICRHGTAYTIIESEYAGISTESTYFVPLGESLECWLLRITNTDARQRRLNVFPFVEYSSHWQLWMDWVNLQYTQYIIEMKVVDGIINHCTNPYLPVVRGDFAADPQSRHTFFALVGAQVSGFDTDREKFIGPYRGYSNPLVVENGKCKNSIAVGDNGCGVFQADLEIEAGDSAEILVLMGIGEAGVEGKAATKKFSSPGKAREALEALKAHWHSMIHAMSVETPDQSFNSMMNAWSPYNCLITYAWSRAASTVYAGERDGLGYRDTVQDLLGVLPLIPDEAGKRLELMITGQVSTGGAMPVVGQFDHHPGREMPPSEDEYRSDDGLWLFNTVPAYVKETGRLEFYDKVLPYSDVGEATVLGHLRRAIEFSLRRSGTHGLPCGLRADWNDCIQLGQKGESVFVAFQLRHALQTYVEISKSLGKSGESEWAMEKLETLDLNISKNAWDGDWFLRGYREDGLTFGSRRNDEGQIFLNPQTWSVISGYSSEERAKRIMDVVRERLSTAYGLVICAPPYEKTDISVMKAALFNKGMKENGSVFCHTQGWAVIAESLLRRGNEAYEIFKNYMPASYNDCAEVREIEPYVYCQSTEAPPSPRAGASRLPWLSGSASWAYFAATQYILGIKPEIDGLVIDPCVPSDWKSFKVSRVFRGKKINIQITNPNGVQSGVVKIVMNGKEISGKVMPLDLMRDINEVQVLMGT
ncbi:MAG TPA: N,N'-diacetylchitobiose phosphorylase [Candidatus Kryptonia bacterium]